LASATAQHHVSHHQHASTVHDYLRVMHRRKWIVLQALLLVPVAAVLFSLRQEKLYEAHAKVLLSHQNLASALTGTPDQSSLVQPERIAQTQADLARLADVADRTLRAAGISRPASDFLAHSSVSPEQNSDLLDFAVTDHDPALAARLASAYAREFTLYRAALDTQSLRNARADLQRRIRELKASRVPSSPVYQSLVVKDQQLTLMEALQTSNASVVQPATNATKVQPRPVRNGILGLALGLFFGVGLAFLREALDTRVRNGDEISERLALPLLARLPEPRRRLGRARRLAMLSEPDGQGAEGFRMLATNLEFVRLDREVRTIMVTSAVEAEGKSTTVANLAVALVRAGQRVALLDLDLRRPLLDQFFDLGDRPGLVQVAIGQVSLEEALIPVALGDIANVQRLGDVTENGDVTGNGHFDAHAHTAPRLLRGGSLHIAVAGATPPNPGEFAGSEALAIILRQLRDGFDTVLIDAPPALEVGDAMALTANVDAVIVISRMNVVRRPMLNEMKRLLDATPAIKLGYVLTGAEAEDGYGYAGGYYYNYGPAAREKVPVS
jgi:Mrp family chromosome partitioning ATPase/capsular polysaccharide biosynthesis protein